MPAERPEPNPLRRLTGARRLAPDDRSLARANGVARERSTGVARWWRALLAASVLLAASAGRAAATCGDGIVSPELGEECDGGECCDAITCTPLVSLCDDFNPCTDQGCISLDGVHAVCAYNTLPNGTSCDDGDFCTGADTCQGGICSHAGNPCPDDGVFCNGQPTCNPSGGCLITFPCRGADGGPNCADTCDEATRSCTAPDRAGSACGDQGRECLVVDTCDGTGHCIDNGVQPSGTACGDQGVECRVDDACDGAGTCVDNGFATPGTACGDPSDSECDAADTCNAAGTCQDNLAAAGTSCGDQGVECRVDDRCDGAGGCVDNGFAAAGTPCGDTSDTACDHPDTCDSGGMCESNEEPASTCGVTDALLSYKIRVPKRDPAGNEIEHNTLPRNWVITAKMTSCSTTPSPTTPRIT